MTSMQRDFSCHDTENEPLRNKNITLGVKHKGEEDATKDQGEVPKTMGRKIELLLVCWNLCTIYVRRERERET
jgi:hypothetical protein